MNSFNGTIFDIPKKDGGTFEYLDAIKRPFYIIGGHCPSPEPEYFLKKTQADVVVIGEGEITIIELLTALERKTDLSTVQGIAFLKNGKCTMIPLSALTKRETR